MCFISEMNENKASEHVFILKEKLHELFVIWKFLNQEKKTIYETML